MKIHSHFVGARTKLLEIDATGRLGMNYAASIDDYNPLYFDDAQDGGAILPPMASLALTWPFTGNFLETWDRNTLTSDFPVEVMRQQVHFGETLFWNRPVQAGEKLHLQGSMAAIFPHRGGTEMVVRYDARDMQGNLVFTEYEGALLRRVRCGDEGTGMENLPAVPKCPPVEHPLWEASSPISKTAAHVYDGCTNMHFPIHTSAKFARSVGLKGIIFQGAATLSMAVRDLTNREAAGDACRVKAVSCRFTGMVMPGSEITLRLLRRTQSETGAALFFDVLNAEGKPAISQGYVLLSP